MDRMQVNFRLDKDLAERLDKKRIALMSEMGRIPSRSEVFRVALDHYLENDHPSKIMKKTSKRSE